MKILKSLPKQIKEQIARQANNQQLQLQRLSNRVQMGALNSRQAFEQIGNHTRSSILDVHNIKETILDVINENYIKNAGFELDEQIAGVPDYWTVVNEIPANFLVARDETKAKYGSGSLVFSGTNLSGSSGKVYVSQVVDGEFFAGEYYTLSFYRLDNHAPLESFKYYVMLDFLGVGGGTIETRQYEVSNHVDTGELANKFARFSEHFIMPDNVSKVKVNIGVEVSADVAQPIYAWIDYVMLHSGMVAYKPGELVAGIIETDHLKADSITAKKIQADAIEARHIKADELMAKIANIETAFILDAQIKNLNADKIEGGRIDTNLVRIESADGILRLNSNLLEILQNEHERLVGLGKYAEGKLGLQILAGEIELGKDIDGNPLFKVDNEGRLTAREGLIANFLITDDELKTVNDSLILNANSSSISLSNHPDYRTTFRPSGLFGKAPIARLQYFADIFGDAKYYMEIDRVYLGEEVYEENVDYSYSRKTGEIIKRQGSTMPDTVWVDYHVVDSLGVKQSLMDAAFMGMTLEPQSIPVLGDEPTQETNVVPYTEQVTFVARERASAIITDDALLDASFVTNLIVGAAQIGYASIDSAHIKELHGDKILAETIKARHFSTDALQSKFAEINEAFINSAHIKEIDVSKLKIGGQQMKSKYHTPPGSIIFNFNNSLMSNNGIMAEVV